MTKQKSIAFKCFMHWTTLMQNQTRMKVKPLRTNNGMKFCSKEFNGFCKEEGIARQHTTQQNGVAKRINVTLLEGLSAKRVLNQYFLFVCYPIYVLFFPNLNSSFLELKPTKTRAELIRLFKFAGSHIPQHIADTV